MIPPMVETDKETGEVKRYELGFLLSPLLPETAVGELVASRIKTLITELGGTVGGETTPRLFGLAYPIRRVVEHKASVFKEAYFGWLALTLPPEALVVLRDNLKKIPELIRSLVLLVPPPSAAPADKPSVGREKRERFRSPAPSAPAVTLALSPEALNQEIDKEIEQLIKV